MKKLILAMLIGLCGLAKAQNPTLVYSQGGVTNIPGTTHAGKVTLSLETNNYSSGVTQFYQHNTSGQYRWDTNSAGGSGTPGGVSGNIQYNNAGAFGGTNNLNLILSGNNATVTNGGLGTLTFSCPSTNFNVFARRAFFGPPTVVAPEIYDDYYFKGQKTDFPTFRFDSVTTAKGVFQVQFDESSSGGFEMDLGRMAGNPTLQVFMGNTATSPIQFIAGGTTDIQTLINSTSKYSIGQGILATAMQQEYAHFTNDAIRFNKQLVFPQQTLTYSGTSNLVWKVTNSPVAFINLTNNAYVQPQGIYAGASYQLTVVQGVPGNFTMIYSNIVWAGGVAPTLPTNAGAVTVLNFTGYSTNGTTTTLGGAFLNDLR